MPPGAGQRRCAPVLYCLVGEWTCTRGNVHDQGGRLDGLPPRLGLIEAFALTPARACHRKATVQVRIPTGISAPGPGSISMRRLPAVAARNYRMYSYVTKGLPALVEGNFPVRAGSRAASSTPCSTWAGIFAPMIEIALNLNPGTALTECQFMAAHFVSADLKPSSGGAVGHRVAFDATISASTARAGRYFDRFASLLMAAGQIALSHGRSRYWSTRGWTISSCGTNSAPRPWKSAAAASEAGAHVLRRHCRLRPFTTAVHPKLYRRPYAVALAEAAWGWLEARPFLEKIW